MSKPTLTEIRAHVDRTFSQQFDDDLQSSPRATFLDIIDRLIAASLSLTVKPAREDQYGFARRRIDSVRHVELIEVDTAEGEGSDGDHVRPVARFYLPNGTLIAIGTPSGE